jgi:UDPglucose 6-dehydrogenase
VQAFDPEAREARQILRDIAFRDNAYEAATGADALLILTEWDQFRALDLNRIKALMRGNHVIDLRNIYPADDMVRRGFSYRGIGKPGRD